MAWLAPVAFVLVLAVYLGLRIGGEVAAITESDVIEMLAQVYVDEHKERFGSPGLETDCIAVPSEALGIWIELRCTPEVHEQVFTYGVTRSGRRVAA
ncbi:MAG: hypothetical protein AAF330_03950, partial [Pseudomonadota bacterium]